MKLEWPQIFVIIWIVVSSMTGIYRVLDDKLEANRAFGGIIGVILGYAVFFAVLWIGGFFS